MIKTVQDIINIMEKWYPPEIAESWDKIGLQIGNPQNTVRNILLCLDITEDVVRESVQLKIDLIIAHHPFIFHPLESLLESDKYTRMIQLLLKNKISVYIAHTNMDFASDGTSHYLANVLKLIKLRPLKLNHEPQFKKLTVFVPESHIDKVSQAMFNANAGIIGEYSHCSFRIPGIGTFQGATSSTPYIGQAGQLEKVNEIRLEMLVNSRHLNQIIYAMKSAHPYEEVAYDIYSLDNPHPNASKGIIGELNKTSRLDSISKFIKQKLKLKGLRFTGEPNWKIRTIAVVSGSGADFIPEAIKNQCDALITGDIKYHSALDAYFAKLAILDIGHYPSENMYLPYLLKKLDKIIKTENSDIKIQLANNIFDPFNYL